MDKFIEKDLSVQDKIAERYNMITMEELDNQFNTLKNKKRKHKSRYLFILHYFVYQFNNNIVTRIFLFPDHLKENSKKDRCRWQKNRPSAKLPASHLR